MIETGEKYGKLTAIEPTGVKGKRGAEWIMECECGVREARMSSIVLQAVRVDKTPMCKQCVAKLHKDPARHTKHGMVGTRMYRIWQSLKGRCVNPNNTAYCNYGGRGITVCERWEKFENFYIDMKDGYADDLQIDRIDNNKGYGPDNCRWVTRHENMRNKRGSIISVDVTELAKQYGLHKNTVRHRVNAGWPIDMLTIPATHKHSRIGVKGSHTYKRKYKEV